VSLACWELAIGILGGLAICGMALKIFPLCRVKTLRPDMPILKRIWSYSLTTFVFIVALQIITNTDNLVVGAFVGVQMVAFYAIGGSLIDYSWRVVSAVSTTFTPIASNLEASGRDEDLRRFLMRGTQATLAIAIPITWALALRGKTFIQLWMGPQFRDIAGNVLEIMIVCQFFGVANSTAGSVMMAIDKHKPVAKWAVIEAVLNFTCSIILVKTIGLYGVAWGTTIAETFVHLYFYPGYVQKILGIPARTYVMQGWLKIAACSLPYALLLAITDKYWHAGNLITFFAQIAAVLPAYLLCVALIFRSEVRGLFLKWQASKLVQA
jgi:O-antigen/teichoic acid export membrane protein